MCAKGAHTAFAALILALGLVPVSAHAYGGGIVGYSGQSPGVTCNSCHAIPSGVAQPTVTVAGPSSLTYGQTGNYTLTITGGPGVRGGMNVASDNFNATLGGVTGQTQASAGEVTHTASRAFSGGSVVFQFTVRAPSTGTQLRLFGAGNSTNGSGSTGDRDNSTVFTINLSGGANAAPTIATAAAASPSSVTGSTAALSVLGADDGGEAALRYTWSATGPSPVTFSVNGTNAAKSATANFTGAGSYSLTATITDAAGASVQSTVAVTVAQTLTAISVSPASASVQVGQTRSYTASATDQFSRPMAAAPSFSWTVSGGGTISTAGLFTAGTTAGGPFTVTASASGRSGTAQISVTAAPNGAPTIATAAAAFPVPVTGSTATLSVLGSDDQGEAALLYTWAMTSGPAAVTFSANGTNAAKSATATFTRAGAYVIGVTVRDGAGLTATSSVNVTVNQTVTAIAVSPASVSVQVGQSQSFSAAATDQFGQAVSPAPSFSWTVSGGGTISGAGAFTAGATAGGPFTVTASASGRSGTAQVTVSSAPNSAPTIAAAAAANPSPVTGTSAQLSVLGADAQGEAALTYTWAMTAGPAAVTFSANGTNGAKGATVTFTRSGSYTLGVTVRDAGGLTATSSVTVAVNQTLTQIAVSPSSASVLVGASQSFSAAASDQFGQPMAAPPAFAWTASGGGTISAAGAFTAGTTAGGPFTISASASGRSGTAQITVTSAPNASPTIATAAAANPNPVTGTNAQLSVLGADDGGEALLTYTWSATGPASVVFSANGSNAAKSALATFSKAGSYQLTATVRDAAGAQTQSLLTVTVDQTLALLTVSPSAAGVAPSGTQSFTARGVDQFGDAIATLPTIAWSVSGGGAINAAGVFTAGTTAGGPFIVTANASGRTATAQVSIAAGQAPVITQPARSVQSPVLGTFADLSVLAADDAGEAALVYSWAVSAPPAPVTFTANDSNAARSTRATFTRAGSYMFTVTVKDAGGLSATSNVTVEVAQDLAVLAVVPAQASVPASGSQQFSVSAQDQFGGAISPAPAVAWTGNGGGTINSQGLFRAAASVGGPYTVTAATGSKTANAEVRVVAGGAPSVVQAPSALPALVTGRSTLLRVLADDDGGEAALVYRWTAVGPGPVTFSGNDSNGAKSSTASFARAGSYEITATVTDQGGLSASSQVMLTVSATLTVLEVTPALVTVMPGASQNFSAAAQDQFGALLLPAPQVTWAISGGGTIDQNGVFTARSTPGGQFIVSALAGSVRATAQVALGQAPIDAVAPQISLGSLPEKLTGAVRFVPQVSDDVAVAEVTLLIDGAQLARVTQAPWELLLDTADLEDGAHTLELVAKDIAGNAARAQARVETFNHPQANRGAPVTGEVDFGCSATGALPAAWLLLLSVAGLRRRQRRS
jgi:hypothetical protein